MLDSLYATLFRPTQARLQGYALAGLWVLLSLILALNAAGAFGLGAGGVVGLTVTFGMGSFLGWYWLAASVNFLAQVLGGQGSAQTTMTAIAAGFWPLLLTAPAIALKQWLGGMGELISLAVILWVFFTLIQGIRQTHHLSWGQAGLCLAATLLLGIGALLGLLIWPFMLFAGT